MKLHLSPSDPQIGDHAPADDILSGSRILYGTECGYDFVIIYFHYSDAFCLEPDYEEIVSPLQGLERVRAAQSYQADAPVGLFNKYFIPMATIASWMLSCRTWMRVSRSKHRGPGG